MSKKILIIIAVILVILGLSWFKMRTGESPAVNRENTAAGKGVSSTAAANGPVGVATGINGKYLTDKNGMTLYVSIKDENPSGKISQSCDTNCEKTWLPYLLGESELGLTGSTDPLLSRLNILKRTDGREQYAFGTQPLYRSASDLKAGDIKGDVSGNWQVAKP